MEMNKCISFDSFYTFPELFMFAGDGFKGPDVPAGYRDRHVPGGAGLWPTD